MSSFPEEEEDVFETYAQDAVLVLQLQQQISAYEQENARLRAQLESQRVLFEQMQRDVLLSSDTQSMNKRHRRAEEDDRDPLVMAARKGDAHMVKIILDSLHAEKTRERNEEEEGLRAEEREKRGEKEEAGGDKKKAQVEVPLLVACQEGHVDVVNHLLDRGADVHVDYDSPLLWAAEKGDARLAKLLLQRGADANTLNGCALRIAVRRGHHEIAELLLRHGARLC